MDTKKLFALAEADEADGLVAALKDAPETHKIRSQSGETLYQFSVYRGRTKCAEALQKRGNLSLHEAALAGDVGRVDELLDNAPWAIDVLSADGWTALHLAAFVGRDAVAVRLLDRGADAHVWARAFETNLPIHAACAGRRIGKEAFTKLVAATGDPDVTPKHGYTPLMEAASNGFADAAEVLLAAGADKTRRHPEKNMTPAEFAQAQGHTALAQRLA